MANKKKKKSSFNPAMLVFVAIGGVCGFFGAKLLDNLSFGDVSLPVVIVFLIAVFFASFALATFIHEAGHLVLGLLTGYDFVSFRIGSITFIKESGKLARRKFNIVGTGGQCILSHKQVENPADIPYFWYHFGGVFFNFLSVLLCVPVILLVKNPFVLAGFWVFGIISFVLGVMNILPTKATGVGTDGYNLIQMKKSSANRVALYKTMVINALQYQGTRLTDMDASLVTFTDEEKQCTFGNNLTIMEAALLMYKHDFAATAEICRAIVEDKNTYTLYKNECKCELLFCMIMTGAAQAEIDELYDKELRQYVKATEKTYIARKRLLYAYNLIVLKDAEKADAEWRLAEKMADTYPSKGEYLAEMDLMEYVRGNFS